MDEKTALAKMDDRMSIQEVRANVNLIQQVMQGIMKEGEHYGKIPGCGPKPTLLKPGAEKISSTFRLYPEPEIISEVDTPLEYTVKVRVRLIHGPSGVFCGSGVGACSSLEEKYGWREAACAEEFDATPEDRKRIKYKRYENQVQKINQISAEPKTVMNTILKMAKKRAYVDAVLSATAASDIFTQDLEDMDLPGTSVKTPTPKQEQPKKRLLTFDGLIKQERLPEKLVLMFLEEKAVADGGDVNSLKEKALDRPKSFLTAFQKWYDQKMAEEEAAANNQTAVEEGALV